MPEYLSYSGLSSYNTCGEQYRLDRIVGLPDLPGVYHAGGTAVHLATAAKDWATLGSTDPVLSFNEYFNQAMEEQEQETGTTRDQWKVAGRKPNVEDIPWWRLNGGSFVASWGRWFNNTGWTTWITPDGEPAIELGMEEPIGDVPSHGFIDRVLVDDQGELVVVDLKTGKPPKDRLQLATYASYINSRYGVNCTRGGYWMARGGILTGKHDLSPLLDGRLEYEYSQAWKGIENEIFPAKPSGLCANWCPFNKYCYSYSPGSPEAASVSPF
jgi:putative RecB family exonuclease